MVIRAMFTLSSVTDHVGGNKTYRFQAQYSADIPEDQQFHKYTPDGNLEMLVSNPSVIERLTLGSRYYIDLTPVVPPEG